MLGCVCRVVLSVVSFIDNRMLPCTARALARSMAQVMQSSVHKVSGFHETAWKAVQESMTTSSQSRGLS